MQTEHEILPQVALAQHDDQLQDVSPVDAQVPDDFPDELIELSSRTSAAAGHEGQSSEERESLGWAGAPRGKKGLT